MREKAEKHPKKTKKHLKNTSKKREKEEKKTPRKNFPRLKARLRFATPVENSPAGFSGEKPNDAGASQCYANDCGAPLRFADYLN